MTVVDWNQLKKHADDATKVLEEGEYPVEVETAEATVSKAGNPQVKLKVRVTDGPATGRALFTQLTISDSGFALGKFFDGLAALGVTQDVLAGGPSLEQVAAALVGRRADAVVDVGQYLGADRNGVKGFKPSTSVTQLQGVVVIGVALGDGVPSSVASPTGVPAAVGTPAVGVPTGPISVVPTVTDGPPPPSF